MIGGDRFFPGFDLISHFCIIMYIHYSRYGILAGNGSLVSSPA